MAANDAPPPQDAATRINQAYHRWTVHSDDDDYNDGGQANSKSSNSSLFNGSRGSRGSHATHASELSPHPQKHQAAQHNPDLVPFFPGEPKSLSGIALRAFCLGLAAAASAAAIVAILVQTGGDTGSSSNPIWRVPFFLLALSVFHFLEFWTTAERNTLVASIDSFLLTANWPSYAIAHSAAFLECLVVCYFFPSRAWTPLGLGPLFCGVGLVVTLVGQVVRSAAMLEAGVSFNHHVQTKKAETHRLVTDGIYAWLRHPSYFGFFYWGLGTQLVLGNVVCFFAYAWVLWTFFHARIRHEEAKLVDFFQDEYVQYRKRVGTLIPFIR